MPFDFAAISAPFRMQPGLRRLAPGARQLTPNRPGERALREKLAVLCSDAPGALLAEPDFDPDPALAALLAHAAAEWPEALALERQGAAMTIHAPLLGWSLHGDAPRGDGPAGIGACLAALPPAWRRAGLLALAFAEDFAVLDGASTRIPWLAVCLPSHWSPAEKVGHPFAEVHAPVADNQLLLSAAGHLARLVTGAERWERQVWTITNTPGLDNHPQRVAKPAWPAGADAAALAAGALFRTEHQTFIPLPAQRQAVFTIHVDSRPLVEAITSAEQAAAVQAALASMSPSVLAYRGLTEARDRLLDWLATRR